MSIQQTPQTLFPGTGYPAERGHGAAAGTSVNVALPAGTGDAAWLRAFHAVVPGVVRAFGPEILVTQHGTDSHREDPLADLNLSIDGQHTSYEALRELAPTVTGGRWLALGGGGYSPVRVVPRAWTHLLAIVSGHDIDPGPPRCPPAGSPTPPPPAPKRRCRKTCPTAHPTPFPSDPGTAASSNPSTGPSRTPAPRSTRYTDSMAESLYARMGALRSPRLTPGGRVPPMRRQLADPQHPPKVAAATRWGGSDMSWRCPATPSHSHQLLVPSAPTASLADLPPVSWQRLSAGAGSKGQRMYSWAYLSLPSDEAGEQWILMRRTAPT